MPDAAAIKVLLVDDDVKYACWFARQLRRHGLEVRACHDGPSAVETASAWEPHVVLLDSRMPGMDGATTCRKLRETRWHGIVLFFSGWQGTKEVVAALRAGGDDHVYKGVSDDELLAKIYRAAERTVQLRELEARDAATPSGSGDAVARSSAPPGLGVIQDRLLERLLLADGEIVPARELIGAAWGDENVSEHALRQRLSDLRDKVEPIGWRIENVRGKGYRLLCDPE